MDFHWEIRSFTLFLCWQSGSAEKINTEFIYYKLLVTRTSLVFYSGISRPFRMFYNGVDENFQHHFVINIGYCFTKACSTNIITI